MSNNIKNTREWADKLFKHYESLGIDVDGIRIDSGSPEEKYIFKKPTKIISIDVAKMMNCKNLSLVKKVKSPSEDIPLKKWSEEFDFPVANIQILKSMSIDIIKINH